MKRRNVLVIALFISLFGGWTETERAMFGGYLCIQAVDLRQTLAITEDPNKYELNPILGRYPSRGEVKAYFVASIAATYLAADYVGPRYRMPVLWTVFLFEAVVVKHNVSIGLRW